MMMTDSIVVVVDQVEFVVVVVEIPLDVAAIVNMIEIVIVKFCASANHCCHAKKAMMMVD